MENSEYYYEISLLKAYIVGVVTLIIFVPFTSLMGWLMIDYISKNDPAMGLLFALFLLIFLVFDFMSLYLMLYSKAAYITDKGLGSNNRLGHFYLEWEKIEYVEFNAGNMIIGNKDSHLSLPTYEYWGGKEKKQALQQFKFELSRRNLQPKATFRATLPFFRNCRKSDL